MQPNYSVDNTPLNTALSYLTRNWPVFPCRAADEEATDRTTGQVKYDQETGEVEILKVKTPYTDNGFKAATKFRHIVERWWSDHPTAMIGVPTGSRINAWVLDIDPRHDGHNTLTALEEEYGGLPDTLTATTASGGKHYYFRHVPGVRNRGNLGPGIDVRGDGGYVIAPGSVTAAGGRYDWDNDLEPVDAPEWLLALVVRKAQETTTVVRHSGTTTNSAYVNAAVDRELADLAGVGMGNRNNALNDSAFALGQFVGAGALSESEARALLQDVARGWGRDWARCCKTIDNGLSAGRMQPREIPSPNGGGDNTRLIDVTQMIANGIKKASERGKNTNNKVAGVGEKSDQVSSEVIVDNEESSPDEAAGLSPATDQPAFVATPFTWRDPKTLPLREFAFGTHYIRKFVSVTVSPGGLGKTSNSIVEALSMVSGKELAGTKAPPKRLKVWLFNAEDPRDEMDRRIMGACIHYNLKPKDVDGHLFLDTGREQELVIMEEDRKTGIRINKPVVEAVVEQIRANDIDVMIIDPFVSTHRVNENDNGAIDKVAKLWAQIADMTNCSVDVVHHLRKMSDREATVEDARGAVSLIGAARSVRVLNRMTEDQATKAGIDPSDRFSYFWIHYGKANLTKADNTQHWRKMESVHLGNGTGIMRPQDSAGVVTAWKWPSKDDVAAQIPDDVRKEVLVRLANQNCRESSQSEDWAGYILASAMGVDLQTTKAMTPEKRRIKAALDSWIDNGVLVAVNEPDPKHITRKIKYIRPAQTAQ